MYDSLAVSVKRLTEGDMRLQEATTKVLEQYANTEIGGRPANGQRKQKRHWWEEHGDEWRAKRKTNRKGKDKKSKSNREK